VSTHLDVPEALPLIWLFALIVSSLRRGRRKSIRVGLRARGSWTWASPLWGAASMDEDSAIMEGQDLESNHAGARVGLGSRVSYMWCQPSRQC
jgi:hypothetical protein